jgi:hypothetical protein
MPLDPRFADSNSAKAIKIPSTPSFRGEVKPEASIT